MLKPNALHRILQIVLLTILGMGYAPAQLSLHDSTRLINARDEKITNFYDTLKVRAARKNFTRILYDFVVKDEPRNRDQKLHRENSYTDAEGKLIREIRFLRLDVFGPSLQDTSRKAKSWIERTGNILHTRSDLHNLRKNLIIKPGDTLNSELLYENERLFRTLPRIRDARFILLPDSLNPDIVDLLLITQDRFSIGVSGVLNGTSSAKAEIYNRNLFGVGHEASFRFVGHMNRQPYIGFESFYNINNINGKFLNFSAGYSNTYLNEGTLTLFEKPLVLKTDQFAYGISGYSYKRTNRLPGLKKQFPYDIPNYSQLNVWGARNIQLKDRNDRETQLTFASGIQIRNVKYDHHFTGDTAIYFSDNKQYLFGITWSQRNYIPDRLIYGYGITEDIPMGFKYEMVAGLDNHVTGKRIYTHVFLSNGNFFRNAPDHLYMYGSYSGYFRNARQQQGMIEFGMNFISRLYAIGNVRSRHFVRFDYTRGINRLDPEELMFEKNDFIRGFSSDRISGKQRLSLNLESVFFQKKDFYRFNIAFFTFGDLGILGGEGRNILKENYYGGFGAGLRLHNESLVLKTILVRLAVYPRHPNDVGLLGMLVTEQTKQTFYNFQPGPPEPRRYE